MSSKAKLKYLRMAPRKVRLVADLIRGKNINEAIAMLTFSPKKAAVHIAKLLKSAVANAEQTGKVDIDTLYIKSITVDEGSHFPPRFRPRAHGRATPILKRTSHVNVELEER